MSEKDYVQREFADLLVGRTIVSVGMLSKEEVEDLDWEHYRMSTPIYFELDDGAIVIPCQDPEMNGPGHLFIQPPLAAA